MLHGHAGVAKRSDISRRKVGGTILPTLPAARSNVPYAPFAPMLDARQHHTSSLRRRLLIVGASRETNSALARGLEHPSLSVSCALTSEEASSIIASEPMDFVLADLDLDGASGIDLLESLRRDCPHTQRVLVTPCSEVKTIREAIKRADVSFFLGKPWDEYGLRDLIRGLLLSEQYAGPHSESPSHLS